MRTRAKSEADVMVLEVLGAIGSAVSAANGARQLLSGWAKRKPTDDDVRAVQDCVNELLGQLSAATVQVAQLRDENLRLADQVKALERRADLDGRRRWQDGLPYLNDPPRGHSEGPYCPGCWAVDLHVPLKRSQRSEDFSWSCPKCQARFGEQIPRYRGWSDA